MLLCLATALPTMMKVSLTKRGLERYIHKLIDTAVENFQEINFPEIDENVSLGPFVCNFGLSDLSVGHFDAHNFTFRLSSQQFFISGAEVGAGFSLKLELLEYPYISFQSYVKAFLKVSADLDAHFALDEDEHLLDFKLLRIRSEIDEISAQFEDQTLQVAFNALKPHFATIIEEVVLPKVYEAIVGEINRRLRETYETEIVHGECNYEYIISEFKVEEEHIVVGYPNHCATAQNWPAARGLIDNYTSDDVNYVLPERLVLGANFDEGVTAQIVPMGVALQERGVVKKLCKLSVRSEKLQVGDMVKTRSYVDIDCPEAPQVAERFNQNSLVITNTDFIEFTGIIYKEGYVVLLGSVQ